MSCVTLSIKDPYERTFTSENQPYKKITVQLSVKEMKE